MAPVLSISLTAGFDPRQRYRLDAGAHGVRLPDMRLDAAGATLWLHRLKVTVEAADPPLDETARSLLELAWRGQAVAVEGHLTLPASDALLLAPGGGQDVTLTVAAEVQQQSISGDWVPRRVMVTSQLRMFWASPADPAGSGPEGTGTEDAGTEGTGTEGTGRHDDTSEQHHHGLLAVDFGTTACTATLWDEDKRSVLPLPRSQTVVLRGRIAELLGEAGPGGVADPAWHRITATLAKEVLGADLSRAALSDAVRGEKDASAPLLHETLRQLESHAAVADERVREWLTGRLYAAHDEAFAAPAPERWQLHELPLEKGDTVLSSVVSVDRDSGAVRVGPPKDDNDDLVVYSIKRHFGRPPGHRDLLDKTDGTVVSAIADLVARSSAAIRKDSSLDHAPLNRIIVTYPTVLHGAARAKLVDDVRRLTGVLEVNNRYDEAIAAGFYYLMRDIGSDPEIGIESLRARMRPTNNPGAFTENLLVVDIGGGTTDIALFAMHLHDVSPVNVGTTSFGPGKLYHVSPSLRGSNGRENRGGDYITLCVFHWLKAAIADALLAAHVEGSGGGAVADSVTHMDKTGDWWHDGAPVPGALTAAELSYLNSADRWSRAQQEVPAHRTAIEQLVPTRWRDDPELRPVFHRLWNTAENAKIEHLGKGRDFTLGPDEVAKLLGTTGVSVSLPAERFRTLVTAIVERLAKLAVELVANRFGDRREPLDRLVLTGRASSLPLVREVFDDAFATAARNYPSLLWDPMALRLDVDHAKSATSIGAVWAERMRTLARLDSKQVVRNGGLDIRVDVDNVFQALAATFTVTMSTGWDIVFKADTEFLADGDQRVLDRDLGQLRRPINIHRVIDGDTEHPVLWGSFDVMDVAERQRYEPALPPAGASRTDDRWLHDKLVRVRINPQMELTLTLWRSDAGDPRPLHSVEQHGGTKLAPPDAARPLSAPDAFALARRLRIAVGNADRSLTREVFPKLPDPPAWTHRFIDESDGTERNGLISSEPLPEAGEQGWRFALIGDGPDAPVQRVSVRDALPEAGGKGMYASLDDQGVFRLHFGRPDYLTVKTLREMDERPGAVFSTPMPPRALADDDSDPFNGLQ
ncbi:hypothetical protein ACFO3J_18370 [Streptomyces polygonati]|uniref:Molecular chaperone n=1 Tax=Streptomyces polygonati TaxID=1617087 RepID=A0ABV8HRK2_9ACTN